MQSERLSFSKSAIPRVSHCLHKHFASNLMKRSRKRTSLKSLFPKSKRLRRSRNSHPNSFTNSFPKSLFTHRIVRTSAAIKPSISITAVLALFISPNPRKAKWCFKSICVIWKKSRITKKRHNPLSGYTVWSSTLTALRVNLLYRRHPKSRLFLAISFCCSLMANNYNFDTDFTVHGNLCINCQTIHKSNYNNLLKYESHILKLGFQVSGYYFLYRLKSTTENSVLAHARENGKRKTSPYLLVYKSVDRCALCFPRWSKRYRNNSHPLMNETSLDRKNKRCILSERKTPSLNSEQICKCFSLYCDQ